MSGEQHLLSDYVPSMADLKRDYLQMRADHYGFVDLYAHEWNRAIEAHNAEVRALPDRETIARAAFAGVGGRWEMVDEKVHATYYAMADHVLALFGGDRS